MLIRTRQVTISIPSRTYLVPETIVHIRDTATLLIPEIMLLATACAMFFVGPMLVSHSGDAEPGLRTRWGFISLVAIAVAWMTWLHGDTSTVQGSLFRIDHLTWFTRGLALSAGFVLVLTM